MVNLPLLSTTAALHSTFYDLQIDGEYLQAPNLALDFYKTLARSTSMEILACIEYAKEIGEVDPLTIEDVMIQPFLEPMLAKPPLMDEVAIDFVNNPLPQGKFLER